MKRHNIKIVKDFCEIVSHDERDTPIGAVVIDPHYLIAAMTHAAPQKMPKDIRMKLEIFDVKRSYPTLGVSFCDIPTGKMVPKEGTFYAIAPYLTDKFTDQGTLKFVTETDQLREEIERLAKVVYHLKKQVKDPDAIGIKDLELTLSELYVKLAKTEA
jgi:hypothetical protein